MSNIENKADQLQGLGRSCMGIGCMIPLIFVLGGFLFLVIGGLLL